MVNGSGLFFFCLFCLTGMIMWMHLSLKASLESTTILKLQVALKTSQDRTLM